MVESDLAAAIGVMQQRVRLPRRQRVAAGAHPASDQVKAGALDAVQEKAVQVAERVYESAVQEARRRLPKPAGSSLRKTGLLNSTYRKSLRRAG